MFFHLFKNFIHSCTGRLLNKTKNDERNQKIEKAATSFAIKNLHFE